jgi:hypothetical protein
MQQLRGTARWAGLAWVLAAVATAKADLLEFRAGGSVEMRAHIDGDLVHLETPGGRFTFTRRDFRRIEPGPWPERDWEAVARRAASGNLDEKLAAARWALNQGLTREAVELVRGIHAEDATHEPAARMATVLEQLARPLPDPDLAAVRAVLPGEFRVSRGPHVVVFHQHEDAEAHERVETLENVITSFHLEFAALGFELRPLESRLVSVWIAERSDYLAYLEADGAAAFRATRGYHHPTRRIVITYDARSDGELQRRLEAIAARRAQLAELATLIDTAPRGAGIRLPELGAASKTLPPHAARRALEAWTRDTDREALLVELAYRRLNLAPAAHETVHQLVVASGLAERQADFPAWLNEGLAMQFEAMRGGRWGGLGTPSSLRLEHWQSLARPPVLSRVLADDGLGPGAGRDAYAAAWAWVYFLRQAHPDTWRTIIDRLRLPSSSSAAAKDRARQAVLDPPDRTLHDWERAWLSFMRDAVRSQHVARAGKPQARATSAERRLTGTTRM